MKYALLILLIGITCSCSSTGNNDKPILFVRNKAQDLGTINFDSTKVISFSLYNQGKAKLEIDSVSASCDCTVPNFVKKSIAPGDSSVLIINYKPVDTGSFSKAIVIKSNVDSTFTIIRFSGTAIKKA